MAYPLPARATDSTIESVRVCWRQGLSVSEISDRLGVSRGCIYRIAQRLDLPHRPISQTYSPPSPPWMTESALADFRIWWAGGMPVSEMARRLGCSVNSIVSKRRQMGLPERGSPIFRGTKYDPKPAPKVKRPPLASVRPEWAPPPLHPLPPPRPVIAAPPPRPVARPVERPAGRVEPCCWVTRMGDGRGRLATYCDDPGVPGKSYCNVHARLAYKPGRHGGEPAHGAAMGGD